MISVWSVCLSESLTTERLSQPVPSNSWRMNGLCLCPGARPGPVLVASVGPLLAPVTRGRHHRAMSGDRGWGRVIESEESGHQALNKHHRREQSQDQISISAGHNHNNVAEKQKTWDQRDHRHCGGNPRASGGVRFWESDQRTQQGG